MSNNSTEFCQARGQVYELGPQRFGATCSIFGQTHHDQNAAFSSKKHAKTAAARDAVLALRDEGILPRPALHKLSVKSAPQLSPAVPEFGAPLLKPIVPVVPVVPVVTTTSEVQTSPSPSASSLVPILCSALNIAAPTYKLVQTSPLTPDFWDGEARFDNSIEPCLRGPVGRVERIYGKRMAKDKVVKQVLEVLESIKQQRMAG
ncbi:hypothetical protein E4T47_02018 [Aureobasidium subglaciale]|nr:hypothetical protein E4T47_02018 [Aureobasidium subglaciale]